MALITKKNILLTGAGFTANFGGLLAREMWAKILNNPKIEKLPTVRELLKNDFDFESVYSGVKNGAAFSSTDKSTLEEIVLESYASMDDALNRYSMGGYGKFDIFVGGVTQLLGSFAGQRGEVGAHFTLNQDLFLERQTQIMPLGLPMYGYRDYCETIQTRQITSKQQVTLPDDNFLNDFKVKHASSHGDNCFIKLHGSIGWLSHDGHNQMILGTNKLEDINREPLLKWYFELFQEAISRPDVKLFVIGYGFRDRHINDCLLRAINEHKLKIYIISPEDPEHFKDRMEGKPPSPASYEISPNIKIWNAVNGYFPYRLKDIFPEDQSTTGVFLDIKRALEV
jgi:hypothetical protein